MTKPKRIIFHCGLPKTGTTTIQYYLMDYQGTLAQHGLLFPFDLSQHPLTPDGVVEGAPQIDGTNKFFDFQRPWPANTDLDWDEQIDILARSDTLHTLIISDEAIFDGAQRIRPEAFAALPKTFAVEFVVYLRHPLDQVNSMILQGISGYQTDYETVLRYLAGYATSYAADGFSKHLEILAQYGRVVVRSFEAAAKADLLTDFCETVGLPNLHTDKGEASNVKSYGADLGLILLGLRKTAENQTDYAAFSQVRLQLSIYTAGLDTSKADLLPDFMYDKVAARWQEERPRIEVEQGISLATDARRTPVPDVLRITPEFGTAVFEATRKALDPEQRRWLRRAIRAAEEGFCLFGSPDDPARDAEYVESQLARVLWISDARMQPDAQSPADLNKAWMELSPKPKAEARKLLKQLRANGLEVSRVL
ncbi:MAG: hypothetical protein AAGM84_01705 [Pseudomonadota bacterium]